jgi:hypothetical protein
VLLQDADDLLFRETAAPHVLVLSMGQNELQTGLSQRGNVKWFSGDHLGRRGMQKPNILCLNQFL